MFKTPSLIRTRIERFHLDLIRGAVYAQHAPLAMALYQSADPIPYAQAVRQHFTPVPLGVRFGPRWSTAWFHLTGTVPAEMAGRRVALRFKSETEALVYRDGAPDQGMERNHDEYVLLESAHGGEAVDLYVECGVNTFFGAGGGSRRDARQPVNSLRDPQAESLPGHLHTCELVTLNDAVVELAWDLEFLRSLEARLPEKSPRKRQILHALNDAVNAVDPGDIPGTACRARDILAPVLATPAGGSAARCFAVGHAHIDTAWLWPLRETVRKCSRTFATQLRLMDAYPDYVFMASQAQLYAFVEQHYPALFQRIAHKVQTGQWEPGGAMWVEADCNIPSGESLVRQILHGTNYWHHHFGPAHGRKKANAYLWLPDVFGYSAALPQILHQAGIDTFITQKISWSQFNKFPHHTFYWQGIDGTKILSHFLPADTYNAANYPDELIHAQENNQDADRANLFLTAFGFGDGGGGPTRQHIEFVHRAANCDGLPTARCSRVDAFIQALRNDARDLQTWVGELYLELHRGTYTTQARNKRANRQAESLLHDTEFFCCLPPLAAPDAADPLANYPAAALDAAWKTVLLNQFHDIIPGSSITWVYEDSLEQYAQVRQSLDHLLAQAAARWLAQIDTSAAQHPLVVFNTLSWDDSGLLLLPLDRLGVAPAQAQRFRALRNASGRLISPIQAVETPQGPALLARVAEVPPLGYALFDFAADSAPLNPTEAVTASVSAPPPDAPEALSPADAQAVLENRLLRAEFDAAGRLTRLFDKLAKRELVDPARPANQLVLYDDRPNEWNAWDIDLFYLEQPHPVETPARLTLVESGPLRAALEVTRPLGQASRLTQRIELAAESLRLDFVTRVEWRENARLLRVLHPLNLLSPRATYEIQFGCAERPTHFNTSWDYARFEVCAQTWADLAEPDYGVALLNDAKYGHSCHGNVLGLSLLRSPHSPDPLADRGEQFFTYALLAHPGSFRDRPLGPGSSVLEQAHRLNTPLRPFVTTSHRGPLTNRFAALSCDRPNVIIETLKRAEEDGRLIVRLYEAHGQRGPVALTVNFPFHKAVAVDLLEQPTELYRLAAESRTVRLELTPFAIRTIAFDLVKSSDVSG